MVSVINHARFTNTVGIFMSNGIIRTRFAPAPTGLMHLGNVRTALMNYLFARKNKGDFVIRVEDTDQQRNFDPGAQHILQDLAWLGLSYNEGPETGGPYAPYFQSQRFALYQQALQKFIEQNAVYRCFCTNEELEKKRKRQLALRLPPRYDRTCLDLSAHIIEENLQKGVPFIWRLKLPQQGTVDINDLARNIIHFDLKNFSDYPLTRQDGSFTFLFANFVDDVAMEITHVFRGEDHLTNTAVQAVMYSISNKASPIYWHMPILCNEQGKKLSKRDFGFSLNDLRQAGYLPEAICNYLAIIGGGIFEQEIMSLDELVNTIDFTQISTASQIRYDVEKLTWVNHAWITRLSDETVAQLCLPFVKHEYPEATVTTVSLTPLIQKIKSDLPTLKDCTKILQFYFQPPQTTTLHLAAYQHPKISERIARLLVDSMVNSPDITTSPEAFLRNIKTAAQEDKILNKELFLFMRMALMGKPEGLAINDLVAMLGWQEVVARFKALCHQL